MGVGVSLLLLLSFALQMTAGETGRITGTVYDAISGDVLAAANIEIVGTRFGDATDSTGVFSVATLPAGQYTVRARLIGYRPQTKESITLESGGSVDLTFELEPEPVEMPELEVAGKRVWSKYQNEASMVGVERLPARELSTIPGTIDDPLRAAQIVGGVGGGGDYSGFVAVHGGSPDQNQVILDDVILPIPYRLRIAFGAGLSSLNPYTTGNINFHLGGFSAQYGNALSAVIEAESRDIRSGQVHGQGSINTAELAGVVEGPLPGGSGDFRFSLRRTYYDLLVEQVIDTESTFPAFDDFSAHLGFRIAQNHRLSFTFWRSSEASELKDSLIEHGRLTESVTSYVGSLRWQAIHNRRWQSTTTLSLFHDRSRYNAFAVNSQLSVETELESLDATVIDLAFRHDSSLRISESNWLNLGASISHMPTDLKFERVPQIITYGRFDVPDLVSFDRAGSLISGYAEATSTWSRLDTRLGLRYDYATLIDAKMVSPRLSIALRLGDATMIRASTGVFYQVPNPANLYAQNVPLDIGRNVVSLDPERSFHLLAGIEHDFGLMQARIQFYRKWLDDLLMPIDEETFAPVNSGEGEMQGLEMILKQSDSEQRLSGLISYTIGRARFRDQNTRVWRPFKFDRRHALRGLLSVRVTERWHIRLLGQIASGLPFTDVSGVQIHSRIPGQTAITFVRGDRFAAHFPTFRKIDLRLSYASGPNFSFYLDIINLTNEQNPQDIIWFREAQDGNVSEVSRQTIYQLPRIPSFGLTYRF